MAAIERKAKKYNQKTLAKKKKKELNFFLMPELICRNIMFRISVYAIDLFDSVICLSSQEQETIDIII